MFLKLLYGKSQINLLCFWLVVTVAATCAQEKSATEATVDVNDKIAFIQDGDICVANNDGSGITPITQTEGKIEDFRISPDLKYLAFTKEFAMVEEVGYYEDDEEIPKVPIHSIVFVNLATMEILAEIEPKNDWQKLRHWTTNDRLLYYTSSGYDISGFFEYNIVSGNLQSLTYYDGSALMFGSYSDDRSLMSYTDDVGLGKDFRYRLHVVNHSTGEDKIVVSKPNIFNPCFSQDNQYLAFIEVQTIDSQSVDVVWICGIANESMEETYSAPALAKSDSRMSWSPDGGHIGLFWSPSKSPNAYLFAVGNPTGVQTLRGNHFCWLDDTNLLFVRGNDIYMYDLTERKDRLLIENASKPAALIRRK